MRLEPPVRFTDCVAPVCLPEVNTAFSDECRVAGWGQTGESLLLLVLSVRLSVCLCVYLSVCLLSFYRSQSFWYSLSCCFYIYGHHSHFYISRYPSISSSSSLSLSLSVYISITRPSIYLPPLPSLFSSLP